MTLKRKTMLAVIPIVFFSAFVLMTSQIIVFKRFGERVLYEQADELYQSVISTVSEQGEYIDDFAMYLELRIFKPHTQAESSVPDYIKVPEAELLFGMTMRDPSRFVLLDMQWNMLSPSYEPDWLQKMPDRGIFRSSISKSILNRSNKTVFQPVLRSGTYEDSYPDLFTAWILPRNGYIFIERVRMDQTRLRIRFLKEQSDRAIRRLVVYEGIFLVAITLIVIIISSVFIAHLYLIPIALLQGVVEDMMTGKNSSRWPENRKSDEIAQLGTAFNIMADSILDYQNRLEYLISARLSELEEVRRQAAYGSMMAAGIAHDITGPLGSVNTALSFLDVQLKELSDKFKKESVTQQHMSTFIGMADEGFRIMSSSLEKAITLARSFKDVVADQLGGQKRMIILKDYLDDIVLSYRHRLIRKSINVTISLPDTLSLACDPGVLSQIFINLMENSITHGFSEDRTKDMLSPEIYISASVKNGIIELEYRDNGTGLSVDAREKLFQRMYTTRKSEGGTGFGMMIIHELIYKKLKGTIRYIDPSFEEEGTQGVRFVITLPA